MVLFLRRNFVFKKTIVCFVVKVIDGLLLLLPQTLKQYTQTTFFILYSLFMKISRSHDELRAKSIDLVDAARKSSPHWCHRLAYFDCASFVSRRCTEIVVNHISCCAMSCAVRVEFVVAKRIRTNGLVLRLR